MSIRLVLNDLECTRLWFGEEGQGPAKEMAASQACSRLWSMWDTLPKRGHPAGETEAGMSESEGIKGGKTGRQGKRAPPGG